MILETICKHGHLEHVEPAVVTNTYIRWGRAADYCRRCKEDVVSSQILMDDGSTITVDMAGCGIIGPHAPGAHLSDTEPMIDLLDEDDGICPTCGDLRANCTGDEEFDDEDDEDKLGRRPAGSRLVSEGTDAAWGFSTDEDLGVIGRRIAQRAAEARARIFGRERYTAAAYILLSLLAAGSLLATIHFATTGRWLLALLV